MAKKMSSYKASDFWEEHQHHRTCLGQKSVNIAGTSVSSCARPQDQLENDHSSCNHSYRQIIHIRV